MQRDRVWLINRDCEVISSGQVNCVFCEVTTGRVFNNHK